jgi:ankyrin repeat protein
MSKGMYGAIVRGDIETVRTLISKDPAVLKQHVANQSWLHLAAQEGNVAIMDVLIAAGMPIDQQTVDGTRPPLKVAAAQGHQEACAWLLDHGADINLGLGKSATPIFSAIYSKSLKLVELFVERGADLCATFGPPPKMDVIRFAEEHGTPEVVSFLSTQKRQSEL